MFDVVISCIHEIALSKAQTLPDGRVNASGTSTGSSKGVSQVEYQLTTLPWLTGLIHGSAAVLFTTTFVLKISKHLGKLYIVIVISVFVSLCALVCAFPYTVPHAWHDFLHEMII